jgi:hypothetical protein
MSTSTTPIESARITFTVKGCVARCTFLAGFAYGEIARNDFQKSYDPAYVILMTGAFALAVVAVGMGTLILYYLERCKDGEQQKKFVAQVNNLYVRGCFRLFLVALLLYVLGLGRCGFVYYASNTAAKYAVLATSILFIPVLFWGLVVIVRAQLQLQHNDGVSTDRELLDAATVVGAASGETADRLDELHSSMIKQADMIASRAVYLTSFCQSGVTRFVDTDHPLGSVYLACIVFAYVAAALPAFLLAIEAIFINDTVENAQTAIAVLLKPLHTFLGKCYAASFLAMSLALAFMGWGCGYSDLSWVTLHCGLAAFAMMVFGSLAVRHHKAAVVLQSTKEEKVCEDEDQVVSVLSLINNTGSQATISSGFIYSSVVQYGAAIAPLTFTGNELKLLFLEITTITVASGLITAVYDSLISFAVLDLKPGQQQQAFVRRCAPLVKVCVVCYQISMVCFLASFALIGKVKFTTESLVPTAVSGFGLVLIVAGWILINMWRKRAEERVEDDAAPPADAGERIDAKMNAQDLASGRALFFGGFAYFAVSFFNPLGRSDVVDALYPTAMSFSFVLSAVVVIWSGVAAVNVKECRSLRTRLQFVRAAESLLSVHVALSLIVTCSFVVGFSVIGWVKSIATYYNYAPVMACGTAVFACVLTIALQKIQKAYGRAESDVVRTSRENAAAGAESLESDADAAAVEMVNYRKFLHQIDVNASQTSFIAGNVFYEILFAEAHGALAFNFLYYAAATVTFVSGVGVVLTSGVINFASSELVNDISRRKFASVLKGMLVKRGLFALNCVCTASWLVSLSVFGVVKYKSLHQLWEPALCFSVLSLGALGCSFRSLHKISNQIIGK